MSIVFFDMKRTSTLVSTTGKVHILEDHGLKTVCGLIFIANPLNFDWRENHTNDQPTCQHCKRIASEHPMSFFFSRRVTPL